MARHAVKSSAPEPVKDEARAAVIAAGIVAAVTMLVFLPAIAFDFTRTDDPAYVGNAHVLAGLSLHNLRWAFTTTEGAYWQPLLWLTFMTEATIFGCTPAVTHATNLGLHAINGALLCLLLQWMGVDLVLATLVAILFCIHPMRLEAVAWIPGRKDTLFVFFVLLAALSYLGTERDRRRTWRALPFFILALMAKPAAIVLPALLLCLDLWPLSRFSRERPARLIAEKWPVLITAGVATSYAFVTERHNRGLILDLSALAKIKVAVFAVGVYLRKTVLPPWNDFPWGAYGVDPDFPVPLAATVVAAAAVGLISWFAVSRRGKAPWLLAGWAWFVAALVPVLGFSRFSQTIACERYAYAAHIGFAIALAGALDASLRTGRLSRRLAAAVLCVGALLLLPVTINNLGMWRDTNSFFERMIAVYPRSVWARTIYGNDLVQQGALAEASIQFEKAIELHPERIEAWNDQGVVLAMMGKTKEAVGMFDQALARRQDPAIARNRTIAASKAKDGQWFGILLARPWRDRP